MSLLVKITVLMGIVFMIKKWTKRNKPTFTHSSLRPLGIPCHADAVRLHSFFSLPENYADKHIDSIIQTLGPCDDYFDDDHGLWGYEWKRKTIRVMVNTRSGYLTSVELIDPDDTNTYGKVIKTLWEFKSPADTAPRNV